MTMRLGDVIRSVLHALATGPGHLVIEPMDPAWGARAGSDDVASPMVRPSDLAPARARAVMPA